MGPQSGRTIEITALVAVAATLVGVPSARASAAGAPFSFSNPDLILSWEESAPSFETPTFDDYLANHTAAFRKAVPALFAAGAAPADKEDRGRGGNGADAESHSFAEASASGGSEGRVELAGFYGAEVSVVDAAASFRESRHTSGDGVYGNDLLHASAEAAISDEAGTMVGFAAAYEGNANRLKEYADAYTFPAGDNYARSTEADVFFRSNLWGKAKFATRVSGTFAEGDYGSRHVADQTLAAESGYDFFWLGNKHARGWLELSQENYAVAGNEQGLFFSRLRLENDFPIADRLYLSGGFRAALYRPAPRPLKFYASGRLLWRIGGGCGFFVNYHPNFAVPDFRELYIRHDYVVPTSFRPTADDYFSLRSGFDYYFWDITRLTVSVHEDRYRHTYAPQDLGPGAASYYNPGRTRIRGADLSYRLSWPHFEHYGVAAYAHPRLYDMPGGHFPYLPTYSASGGLIIKFGGGHTATLETEFIGPRYARADAPEPLAPAWVPAAALFIHLPAGVGITAAAENLSDTRYVEAGGVLAPRRSFSAGLRLTF